MPAKGDVSEQSFTGPTSACANLNIALNGLLMINGFCQKGGCSVLMTYGFPHQSEHNPSPVWNDGFGPRNFFAKGRVNGTKGSTIKGYASGLWWTHDVDTTAIQRPPVV